MKIVATTLLPAVDRWKADRWNAARSCQKKKKEKNDGNCGYYVIASSRPPDRRPLERRTLVLKKEKNKNAIESGHWRCCQSAAQMPTDCVLVPKSLKAFH